MSAEGSPPTGGGPRAPGLEPVFGHLDDPDVPWQQVRAVRRADGTVASVWEKWLAFSPDPLYLSLDAAAGPRPASPPGESGS